MLKKIAGVLVSIAPMAAFATTPYDTHTAAVDFTAAGTAVMAGLVAMATVGVLIKGGVVILRKLGIKF